MADSPSLFPPPPLLLLVLSLSVHLSISTFCSLAGVVAPSLLPHAPSFPPILSGLIVLHLFIQAFMAASSSHRPISPPDDGFLPQLSRLFIISVDPHHISLTLGRWFSHWAALPTRHITNPPHKHTHARTHKVTQPERKPHITILHCRFTRR